MVKNGKSDVVDLLPVALSPAASHFIVQTVLMQLLLTRRIQCLLFLLVFFVFAVVFWSNPLLLSTSHPLLYSNITLNPFYF